MDLLYFDIETEGLSPFKDRLHGAGVAFNDEPAQYFRDGQIPDWVLEKLADPSVGKVGSNVRQFDLNFVSHKGFKVAGKVYDTSLIAQVAYDAFPERGLKQLSKLFFGESSVSKKTELDRLLEQLKLRHVGELAKLDFEDPSKGYGDIIAKYCIEDVENTRAVFYKVRDLLREKTEEDKAAGRTVTRRDYYNKEIEPIERLLLKLETTGIRVNENLLAEVQESAQIEKVEALDLFNKTFEAEIAQVNDRLLDKMLSKRSSEKGKAAVLQNPAKYDAVFNIDSSAHFGSLLYNALEVPEDLVKRTKTGNYSTREDDLKLIAASVEPESKTALAITQYLEVKKLGKLINTYIGDDSKGLVSLIQKRGDETWLYPNYKQRTNSGRLANFPLQQMPKTHKNKKAAIVKQFFIPSTDKNCFVYSDLSAVELRNAAHITGDETLIGYFQNGIDPHIQLAARIFRKDPLSIGKGAERDTGKELNYSLIYGCSEGRLVQQLALKYRLNYTKDECRTFRNEFFQLFPDIDRYLTEQKAFIEKNGYAVAENGRVRYLPEVKFGKYLDHEAKRFFGPKEMVDELNDGQERRLTPKELYYTARMKHRHAINAGYNHPNQSLGATMMKRALLQLDKEGFTIRASIHDAVIVEVLKTEAIEAAKRVKQIMESCYPLQVPIEADTKILLSFSEDDIFNPSDVAIAS